MALRTRAKGTAEVHSLEVSHETYTRLRSAGTMGYTFNTLIAGLLDAYDRAKLEGVDLLQPEGGG